MTVSSPNGHRINPVTFHSRPVTGERPAVHCPKRRNVLQSGKKQRYPQLEMLLSPPHIVKARRGL